MQIEFDRLKMPLIESELIGSENLELNDFDIKNLEYDPGKRPKIWEYPPKKIDEVRRANLAKRPHKFKFQWKLSS
ncbi:hypothetical protein Leryth_026876 [Lithospermum erythrorhizon]|nr:hypothetical protein Leryth_026876 [Lithospermum erythrorhizon]